MIVMRRRLGFGLGAGHEGAEAQVEVLHMVCLHPILYVS